MNRLKNNNILILIYSHPELYPPTLNAIDELSNMFNKVTVIHRPFLDNKWKYPDNVELKPAGKKISRNGAMKSSIIFKTFFHIKFIISVFQSVISKKYNTILVYDHLAMLSLYVVRPFINKKTILWYHNHDVASFKKTRKYSIGWMALHAQNKLMKKINIFSLPSKERLTYFKIPDTTNVFVIPNYPSKTRYNKPKILIEKKNNHTLIYQGTIGEGHGLEEIAQAINTSTYLAGYRLKLVGHISSAFKSKLEKVNSSDRIDYEGYIAYNELSKVTNDCYIGIAVLIPKSVNFKTASSASNKIYEYAACGLPVLYYDDPHFNSHLSKFEWAFATDLSIESIQKCILEIEKNYEFLSSQAKEDFEKKLNFENAFNTLSEYLENKKLI